MNKVSDGELGWIFDELVKARAIKISGSTIGSCCLNPVDQPLVRPYIQRIARSLFERIDGENILFDAIVAVPTGGDVWVEALRNIAHERSRVWVPQIRLKKTFFGSFRCARAQASPRPRVLVVDDTVYTGITAASVAGALRYRGYDVAAFAFPVEITGKGRGLIAGRGYKMFSVYSSAFVETWSQTLV